MKKVLKNFLILFSIFIILPLLQTVNAEWYKLSSNPIIPNNIDKKELVNNPRSPAVLYEDNLFKMWFMNQIENKWFLEYVYSYDGINWIKPLDQPVLSPEEYEEEIMSPNILKIGNIYHLWYNSDPFNSNSQIKYAWSYDGINWIKKNEPIITISKWWENKGIYNPYVVYHDNKFYMWYSGWGNDGIWRIGLAFSQDGINWEKYQNNPLTINPNISHVGNFNLKYLNNKLNLWYLTGNTDREEIYKLVSEDGINWYCDSNNLNDCLILRKNGVEFPDTILNDSDTLVINDKIFLYFSGIHNGKWQIGLASNKDLSSNFSITLFIPGLFASWNKEALVYNQSVNQEDWQLNPIVNEYSGLVQTFKNLGLEENKDFYLFNYDWRKSLDNIADDLHQSLNKIKTENQTNQVKFNLVGHSLGGMISRIYSQKYGTEDINKIITVGSPHQGTAQVYKTVEAGEIETPNNIQWLIFKLILQIYKDGIKTDKQIINEKIPVVKDLLATYPFLKDEQNNLIPINNMTVKNNLLLNYNQTYSEIFPYLYTISGKNLDTPFGYQVKPRTIFDQIMDYYPDGRPINQYFNNGDGTVLLSSSQIGNNFSDFELNHGEIIYKKEPIKKIFDQLGLNCQDNQIQEGKQTNVNPSIIFALLSPANLSVTLPDNSVVNDQDGLILLENAQTGKYQLKINGTDNGSYKLIIGEITQNQDIWNTISNETYQGKEDQYSIYFDSQQPKQFFIDQDNDATKLKETIIKEIKKLNNPTNKNLTKALKIFENYKKTGELLIVHKHLFDALNQIDKQKITNLLSIIEKFEHYYQLVAQKPKERPNLLKIEIKYLEKKFIILEKILVAKKNKGKDISSFINFYQLAKEKFENAKQSYNNKNYPLTRILLRSTEELIKKLPF